MSKEVEKLQKQRNVLERKIKKLTGQQYKLGSQVGRINRQIFKILVTDKYGHEVRYKSKSYKIEYPMYLIPVDAAGNTTGWRKRAYYLVEYLKGESKSPLTFIPKKTKKIAHEKK